MLRNEKATRQAAEGVPDVQVAFNSLAMTNCGLILESILEHASDFVSEAEEAGFIARARDFLQRSAYTWLCHHTPMNVL